MDTPQPAWYHGSVAKSKTLHIAKFGYCKALVVALSADEVRDYCRASKVAGDLKVSDDDIANVRIKRVARNVVLDPGMFKIIEHDDTPFRDHPAELSVPGPKNAERKQRKTEVAQAIAETPPYVRFLVRKTGDSKWIAKQANIQDAQEYHTSDLKRAMTLSCKLQAERFIDGVLNGYGEIWTMSDPQFTLVEVRTKKWAP